MTQKWLKGGSGRPTPKWKLNLTQKWLRPHLWVIFGSLLSHLGYGLWKTTAIAKYYGFGHRTIFSTEGSFGWLKSDPGLGTSLAFYRGQKGPCLENSEKGFPGPLGPGVKEARKKSKKSRKRVKNPKKTWRIVIFDSFSIFFSPGAERPREPLFRLFSEFSREGPFWPL